MSFIDKLSIKFMINGSDQRTGHRAGGSNSDCDLGWPRIQSKLLIYENNVI